MTQKILSHNVSEHNRRLFVPHKILTAVLVMIVIAIHIPLILRFTETTFSTRSIESSQANLSSSNFDAFVNDGGDFTTYTDRYWALAASRPALEVTVPGEEFATYTDRYWALAASRPALEVTVPGEEFTTYTDRYWALAASRPALEVTVPGEEFATYTDRYWALAASRPALEVTVPGEEFVTYTYRYWALVEGK